jgi:cytochrome b6-f complex iron-sulfur subunit
MADLAHQSRRHFLQQGLAGLVALIAVACSSGRRKSHPTSSVPTTQGTGTRVDVGSVDEIRASVANTHAPRYISQARAYVSAFPSELASRAKAVYPPEVLPVLAAGVVVLNQRCPHLGCRVPFCPSSQWFECPCHNAKFDRVGEYRAGPSPRGMSVVRASIDHGRLVIDPGTTFPGMPIGTNTTHQAPTGPYCV